MQTEINSIDETLKEILEERKKSLLYRTLQVNNGLIDFCSNDYLSFARSEKIKQRIKEYSEEIKEFSGSTGSRLISGNTSFAEELEKFLAGFHHAEAALLFNSGYDANLGLFSCIAKKDDTIISDELIHASIIDGCRLSYANRLRFFHNDLDDLEKKLQQAEGNIFVAVESVYSMDGDLCPLNATVDLCKKYNANLIVDEAHATGIFGKQGRGLANQLNVEQDIFARVHTFGKAMGCHGAIVAGSELLKNYLINFARAFIFTTALPAHSLISIRCAYEQLEDNFDNSKLHQLIQHFRNEFKNLKDIVLIDSVSPVQSLIISGNEQAKLAALQLQKKGFDVRAILSPTVPAGKERLRISLHLHNSTEQIDQLLAAFSEIFYQ